MRKRKLLISVGGTGGHIYPAIALAQKLRKSHPSVELLFIGGNLSSNRFFQGFGMPFKTISCGFLTPKKPLQSILNFRKIAYGIWESRKNILEFNPDLMIGFGSYHTLPAMIAARFCRLPYMLHASDSIPGKVIRLFSRSAITTAIHFPATAKWLSGKSVHVNMPLREGFQCGLHSKEAARKYFELDEQRRTLLVFGGSQGAAYLNQVLGEACAMHLACRAASIQIIHLTGNPTTAALLRENYRRAGLRACVKEFEPKMELAWQAADFVISRAGAVTIAEQLEFEVPGILIPYPHAADDHQEKNAIFMANTIGCAQMILERHLNIHSLGECLFSCFDAKEQEKKIQAIRFYKKHNQPIELTDLVLEQLK